MLTVKDEFSRFHCFLLLLIELISNLLLSMKWHQWDASCLWREKSSPHSSLWAVMFEGFPACTACSNFPQHLNEIIIWALTQPRTFHFIILNQPLVVLLVCFGPLSCCRVQTFSFSFSQMSSHFSQAGLYFRFDDVSCAAAPKRFQTTTLPPLCAAVSMKVFSCNAIS